MFEKEHPNNGPSLKAWISDPIDEIRVSSTPGGLTLTPNEARDLRDELDVMIATLEDGEHDSGREEPTRSEPADFGHGDSTGVQDL